MRSRIVNGRLVLPTSHVEGLGRLRDLKAEIARIEGQLIDPFRATWPNYARWKEAAA